MNGIETVKDWGIERIIGITQTANILLFPVPYADRLRERAKAEAQVTIPFELGGLLLVGAGMMTRNSWLVSMGTAIGVFSGGFYIIERAFDWYEAKTGTL